MYRKKKPLVHVALLAASLAFAPLAFAEDSEFEPSPDDPPKGDESMPAEIKEFLTYMEELSQRYPDPAKLDVDRFIAEEGERATLLYCKAIGFDGPCALSGEGEDRRYVAVDATSRGDWDWINNHLFNVGVIPEQAGCPAPYEFVGIHMDDENRRNANWRKGWIGATLSGRDTSWRYCRLSRDKSIEFLPWQFPGNQYDYAVLALGFFCPSGARSIARYQDNEDGGYAGAFGDIFPNGVANGNNWWTIYCVFDGAAQSDLGYLADWPNIGASYGVFASYRMPFSLQYGQVFQDDEDRNNQNRWQGSPDETMWDTRNTGRNLSKVR